MIIYNCVVRHYYVTNGYIHSLLLAIIGYCNQPLSVGSYF